MKKYKVEITETLQKTVTIEAESKQRQRIACSLRSQSFGSLSGGTPETPTDHEHQAKLNKKNS